MVSLHNRHILDSQHQHYAISTSWRPVKLFWKRNWVQMWSNYIRAVIIYSQNWPWNHIWICERMKWSLRILKIVMENMFGNTPGQHHISLFAQTKLNWVCTILSYHYEHTIEVSMNCDQLFCWLVSVFQQKQSNRVQDADWYILGWKTTK